MPRSDDTFDRLRAAIDELAAEDADDLLYEARIEARARVRTTLTDALAQSMMEHLHDQLPAAAGETPPAPETRRPDPDIRPSGRLVPSASSELASTRSSELAWYVYGVVSADARVGGSLEGVSLASPVTIVREGALAAVTSQVPLEEFDEARLREHLGDMAWVEATARAHEAVLARVREQATVIPMRMCTVYRTEGGMREMLSREAAPLADALDYLDGKAEWGVKVFTDVARAGGGIRHVDTGAGDTSGASYMERKRTERERRQRAVELAEEAAGQVHDRLSALASESQAIPLQRREASGHRGEMILNGVYLVADSETPALHDEVHALQSELEPEGIELELTGPWPAYNFIPGTIGAAW
jgi:gas vesicle protein GvpL/GvpF